MKLTRPKNPKANPNLFYVSSESGGDKHIVVRHGLLFFCDCKNFSITKLPKLGTPEFEFCKHGKFASNVVKSTPNGTELVEATITTNPLIDKYNKQTAMLTAKLPKKPKYGVFLVGMTGYYHRSASFPKIYNSFEKAQKDINTSNSLNLKYVIREL